MWPPLVFRAIPTYGVLLYAMTGTRAMCDLELGQVVCDTELGQVVCDTELGQVVCDTKLG